MSIVLFHQAARHSGPRLAQFLGIRPVRAQDTGTLDDDRQDFIVRYGSSTGVRLRPSKRTFNRRWALGRYENRLQQMELLRLGGVTVPEFWATRPEIVDGGLLGRSFGSPGRQTTRGRGITPYLDGAVPPSSARHDMYVEFIPKDRQFRVHVINGATRTRELVLNESGPTPTLAIWNYSNGTYRIPADIPSRIVPAALQAVGALRLDFGAVDLITHGHVAYVLEVNTAPGLGDPTLEWYGEQFGAALGLSSVPGWDVVEKLNDPELEQV